MSVQRLNELDASSTLFPEQLDKLFRDKEWIDQLRTLPEGDLVELTGHLNGVRPTAVPTTSRSLLHRFSMVSIARAHRSGSVSACCRKFAVLGGFSPQRINYLPSFLSPLCHQSHLADSAMSTRGPSSGKMFVLNDFGYTPRTTGWQLDK